METLRDPDADLVARCRNPESDEFEQAFEELFLRYRDRVYAIAYRISGSAVDAMDIVQESFGLVFRKLDGFRADALFSTWLFRIVVNCSIDHRRRQQGRLPALVTEAELETEDPASGPERRAEVSELGGQVQQAISMLSPKLRVVLALRYLEDMSYEHLAATLRISLGTVKSRLARAHLALEKVLRKSFPWLGTEQVGQESPPRGRTGGIA